MIRFHHRVEYAIYAVVHWLIRQIPPGKHGHAARILVRMLSPLLASRRRVALRNLRNAYPQESEEWIRRIAQRSFESVATSFLELMAQQSWSAEDVRRLVEIPNIDVVQKLHAKGRGILFLTGHFGNWEMSAQGVRVHSGAPMHVIIKRQTNPLVDRAVNGGRTRFGVGVIPMENSIREVIRVLKAGGMVGLAADQAASKESISVEFFGRMVPTFGGPATFALKTGAAMVLGLAVRQPDGHYVMELKEIPSDDLEGGSDEAVLELTRRHVRMTEETIRQHPDQWMWMHKRWKHVPDRPGVRFEGEAGA